MRIFFFILFLFIHLGLSAQRWTYEWHWGADYQIPHTLKIYQENQPDIIIKRAQYTTEPLYTPWYWVWRFSRWNNDKAWEFEAVHHKMYLKQGSHPDVQRFSISHGLNAMTINRAWLKNKLILRTGIGFMLAHAENTIRNQKDDEHDGVIFNWGYHVTGPVLNLTVGKQIPLWKIFYISAEAKLHSSYVIVPVIDGRAEFFANIVSFGLGLGLDLSNKDKAK